jgi:multidrug efflux pump subunit AcrB
MIAATLQVNAAINQAIAQLPPGTTSTVRHMDPTVFPIIAYSLTSQTVPLTTLRDIGLFQLRPVLTSTACGIWVELRRRRQSRRFGERAARGRSA